AWHARLLRLVPEYRLAHPQSDPARHRDRALGLLSRPLLGDLCRARRIRRRTGARARSLHPARRRADLPVLPRPGPRPSALRRLFLEHAGHGVSRALGPGRALFRVRRSGCLLARSRALRHVMQSMSSRTRISLVPSVGAFVALAIVAFALIYYGAVPWA